MKSTTIAFAVLAAGVNAYPEMSGKAMSKRSMQGGGGGGPAGNSGYSAPVGQDVKTTCLQAHNDGRKAYGVPALAWDDQLAQSAQGWANHIGSSMQHSGHNGYGENLAWNTRGDMRQMILKQWFDECPQYTGGFSEGAGHFSQCVWRDTTHVGCGYNSQNMLVCQYKPAGNMGGGYAQNVPSGRCINAASLPVGSGGAAPPDSGYGGGNGQSPAPSNPGYGGGNQAPTPSNPGYGGGNQAPSHGGRPRPQPPKPAPKPDCDDDDEDQSPQHGGHPRPRPAPQPVYHAPAQQQAPSHGSRPWGHGGHGQAPQNGGNYGDDSDQAPTGGHGGPRPYGGGMGSGPSRGNDYGNQGPSRGGNGGYGGQSGGHGGDDSDCED